MGKKLFAALIVAVIATFAGYNIYQSQRTEPMSDLMLANVEALAEGESLGKFLTVNREEYTIVDKDGNQKTVIILDCKEPHELGYVCA